MRTNDFKIKATLKAAAQVGCILLLAALAAFGQQQINLSAGPASLTLPDGSNVPMWGYSCGAVVSGSTATCAALNPNAAGAWSPVVITVPTGQGLTINLTNNLSFMPTGGTTANTVPTSVVIIGQVGGGLGTSATYVNSPDHSQAQANVTWPIATSPAPTPGTPPVQGKRVQSFATEIEAGNTTGLTWSNLRPGTYLLESGTHPSIQVPMGLYGILVVTQAPTTGASPTAGTAYPGVAYDAEVPVEFSEIDPVQNNSVSAAVNTSGFSATAVWSGQPGGCGNPSSPTYHTCYPPAVNYTPLYYLINGVAFDKTSAGKSLFTTTPATISSPAATNVATAPNGLVLVRMVNAGLRMHVPAIVGSTTTGFNGGGTDAGGKPNTTVTGFSLIAEDGNLIPGVPKVQSDVFMAAGKTYDVMINAPAAPAAGATAPLALPIFDRELSLSGNASERDAGMLAYIGVNGGTVPSSPVTASAVARDDNYSAVITCTAAPCVPFTVSDISKGVIANDTNVYGVQVLNPPTHGTVTLSANGTFTYVPNVGDTTGSDAFDYCANGTVSGTPAVCSGVHAHVTLGAANVESGSGISMGNASFTSQTATYINVPAPGVLAWDKDGAGYPLSVALSTVSMPACSGTPVTPPCITMKANGGFIAVVAPGVTNYSFTYQAQNSQGTVSSATATVTLNFPTPNAPTITVLDAKDKTTQITDYRWIIEEDKTFYVNPNCTQNTGSGPPAPGCPALVQGGTVPTFGVNFHTSHMEYVAQGCTGPLSCESGQTVFDPSTGAHVPAACDAGNGLCDITRSQENPVDPSQVLLDPAKRYYISILPGDAANAFNTGNTSANCLPDGSNCGHTMSGAPIAAACLPASGATTCSGSFAPVTVLAQPNPLPPGKLSVIVFEDDFPLNGEQDNGGGIDVLSPNEPGLGGFEIVLWDDMGASGDVTGQMTYDMFNQPLSNALAGQIDPSTGFDACPVSPQITANVLGTGNVSATNPQGAQQGLTGMIVTCPKYESDGATLSPLAGQAVVANLMPGRFSVQAYPGANRIARGEEWLQTNTLDGQHAHDSFIRIGEPSYFQEYGPAGYHVSIGFANPAIINARHDAVCAGSFGAVGSCSNTVKGTVTGMRLSRTPDERLYSSESHDALAWTQCWVSLGDPDSEDFMFTKCDANGNFQFDKVPGGEWRITIGDQWNDQIIDGLSTGVNVGTSGSGTQEPLCPGQGSTSSVCNMGFIGVQQWQANVYTRTFIDDNKDGLYQPTEIGIPFLNTTVRYRDGSLANNLLTDFGGVANFNETFPLFNWYTVEADTTRYKTTGIHTVYDAGGPADGTTSCAGGNNGSGNAPCGSSKAYNFLANTFERTPLPSDLSVPGAVYCTSADCTGQSVANGPVPSSPSASTGRIDPPWVTAEGWQGFTGESNFIEFAKAPYAPGENGGIHGHVIYASTRPFDDPQLLVQTQWEPLVPHVTMNLYQERFAADGVTKTLTLVDTTQTSSWDDWAQGFRTNPDGSLVLASDGNPVPNMNCPGQLPAPTATTAGDLFFFTLYNQQEYLDVYSNGTNAHLLPYHSQYKCYDGMHNWNQVQPAPYDGMYSFPSVTSMDPKTGEPMGTNCTICVTDPDSSDPYRYGGNATPVAWTAGHGVPMLPAGKYVVEVILPPGYELVKEEDKNILIGDNFIAPVAQQFGALGDIFIIPDQASVASTYDPSGAGYNPNNAQNPTQSLGAGQQAQIVPGFVEPVWPCVGAPHIVPDYISLFPQSAEVAPFAGATRNLCDRKEVTLGNQMGAIAKFYIYTSTHIASKFTGVITDDFTSEFDPFAPAFGEKFAPPNMPVSVKDYAGNEISRVYADHFGLFNGLSYSTWEVNPPNPTGYSPTMMVTCMNDAGPIPDPNNPGKMITDPLYNPAYSQFCYELPFMPGTTDYMDTPVVPTAAFAGGYNFPDCNYPDATPAIKEVDGDGLGPWVAAAGHTITITALGNQNVPDAGYSGPAATAAPFNMKTVTRHYGFGTQCTAVGTGCNAVSSVTIGGVAAQIVSWSDTSIVATVPNGVPACAVQQQAQYGGTAAQCGQLVITTAGGQQSIDTVTVTVGGKSPVHVAATGTIQSAIDNAMPGDLIIVDPGVHNEMLLMWKPVRLQGVGAPSSAINANTQPAGLLLDPWRQRVNCIFGLTLAGVPIDAKHPYDPSGAVTCKQTTQSDPLNMYFTADRLPLEAVVGWDATLNGNLAELLQEPSLMGAYEGAGITVTAKGVDYHGSYPWSDGSEMGAFPTNTTFLTGINNINNGGAGFRVGDANSLCHTSRTNTTNPFPTNFMCNPASIDGLSIENSSQGGGGIFVHGWAHNLQIANNRVFNNAGTLSGGISVGQGEFAPANLQGTAALNAPGSCQFGGPNGTELPYCLDLNVNVHNNSITQNSSIGDELFSATLAGGGGATFCTGSDYYKFNYNWVCGNMSSGEGGGFVHLGFIYNGDIEHNSIIFNQSTNPTIPTNGGGIMVQGTPDTDPVCGTQPDADCPPGLSDGTGPNLVINANLIQGNSADSGSGGGIRLQGINGTEISTFPSQPNRWYGVNVTNNIIANNVAGWDGAGVSLQDALKVNFINNTVAHNDSTATSGVLNNTLGAPLSSAPGGNCVLGAGTSSATSCPQPAGLVSMTNTSLLTTTFTNLKITCPNGHPNCTAFSNPVLLNDLFWQNRAYDIGVGGFGPGGQNQQKVVTLYNAFNGQPVASQSATGACTDPNASYWEIGVRGDSGPAPTQRGPYSLNPQYSVLSDAADYPGANNLGANPTVVSQYCNGSRVPPECTVANGCTSGAGWAVPPGIADAVVPNPVFSLTPAATVDEGNNWINVTWGPLSLSNPAVQGTDGNWGGGAALGNYALQATSPAVDYVPQNGNTFVVPQLQSSDFFGNPRPDPSMPKKFDVGAVEYQGKVAVPVLSSINPPTGSRGSTNLAITIYGSNLGNATGLTGLGSGVSVAPGTFSASASQITALLNITNTAPLGIRNIGITTINGINGNTVAFTVQGATVQIIVPTNMVTSPANRNAKDGTVTVNNTATGPTAGPLTLTALPTIARASGTGTFTIIGGTCTSGYVVNPGASCTITVHYVPPAAPANPSSTAQVTIYDTGTPSTSQKSSTFTAN